jgi:transcriptional regulator of acetoin/glycerol metabolism
MMAKRARELTKDYLIELYHGDHKKGTPKHTIDQMVKITGRSRSTILRKMNQYHIERRKRYFL